MQKREKKLTWALEDARRLFYVPSKEDGLTKECGLGRHHVSSWRDTGWKSVESRRTQETCHTWQQLRRLSVSQLYKNTGKRENKEGQRQGPQQLSCAQLPGELPQIQFLEERKSFPKIRTIRKFFKRALISKIFFLINNLITYFEIQWPNTLVSLLFGKTNVLMTMVIL